MLVLYPLVLFFIDFIAFILLGKWFFYTLLSFFILCQFKLNQEKRFSFWLFYVPISLILLQDNFINVRFGLPLFYLVPAIFFSSKIRLFLDNAIIIVFNLFLVAVFFLQDFLIKWAVLGQNVCLNSTISKISINIILIHLVLLGIWGNRSLFKFFK